MTAVPMVVHLVAWKVCQWEWWAWPRVLRMAAWMASRLAGLMAAMREHRMAVWMAEHSAVHWVPKMVLWKVDSTEQSKACRKAALRARRWDCTRADRWGELMADWRATDWANRRVLRLA